MVNRRSYRLLERPPPFVRPEPGALSRPASRLASRPPDGDEPLPLGVDADPPLFALSPLRAEEAAGSPVFEGALPACCATAVVAHSKNTPATLILFIV